MALIGLNNLHDLHAILPDILKLKPSIFDMLNQSAIELVLHINPNQLTAAIENPTAAVHLFIEFDDQKEADQKKALKKLEKIVQKVGGSFTSANQPEDMERYWKIRHSVSTILTRPHGHAKAVPITEDISVPIINLVDFLQKAAEIYESRGLVAAAWGHAGDGVVRMHPMLNLGQVGDRQKLIKVSEAIYSLTKDLEGSITAAAGDGRVRAPYTSSLYSPQFYNLILKIKNIFDPYGILNPGVKTASADDVKNSLREDYSLDHHHEHLPRS
jgi:FAD/FMN-containing dehydrogenase